MKELATQLDKARREAEAAGKMLNKSQAALDTATTSAALIADKKRQASGNAKTVEELKAEAQKKVEKTKEKQKAASSGAGAGNLKE